MKHPNALSMSSRCAPFRASHRARSLKAPAPATDELYVIGQRLEETTPQDSRDSATGSSC